MRVRGHFKPHLPDSGSVGLSMESTGALCRAEGAGRAEAAQEHMHAEKPLHDFTARIHGSHAERRSRKKKETSRLIEGLKDHSPPPQIMENKKNSSGGNSKKHSKSMGERRDAGSGSNYSTGDPLDRLGVCVRISGGFIGFDRVTQGNKTESLGRGANEIILRRFPSHSLVNPYSYHPPPPHTHHHTHM